MKCHECGGTGKEMYFNGRYYIQITCRNCGGKGIVTQTNEEWFCGLSTEEKAKWLYDHYVNARADEYYGRQEKTLCDYQKWLVDVHKGIDGTRVG